MPPPRVYRSTEQRRQEIVEATIAVLAARGHAATSFGRICEEAGLSSTRMISYHFADKDALLRAVVEHVVQGATAVMVPAMEAEASWRGKLGAYLRTNLQYLADNRLAARAVIEVMVAAPPVDNSLREDTSALLLSVLLSQGQEAGEFGDFDTLVVARSIRATVDAFAKNIPATAETVDHTIAEIVALFDRATRQKETL